MKQETNIILVSKQIAHILLVSKQETHIILVSICFMTMKRLGNHCFGCYFTWWSEKTTASERADHKTQKRLCCAQSWLQQREEKACYHRLLKGILVLNFDIMFSEVMITCYLQSIKLKSFWILVWKHIFVAVVFEQHFFMLKALFDTMWGHLKNVASGLYA